MSTVALPRPSPSLALVGVGIGVLFAAPLLYLIGENLLGGTNNREVLWSSATLEPLGRSMALATAVALSSSLVGLGTAWLTTRTDLPGRQVFGVLAPLPLVFPSFVGAIALLNALAPGGLVEALLQPVGMDSFPQMKGFRGSWFVLTLFTYPLVHLPVAARLRALNPAHEESARLLGQSAWGSFATVVMPQCREALSAGGLLVLLYVLSDFGVVQLMRYDTLTRVIYENRLIRPEVSLGAALLVGVMALGVVALQRRFRGHHQTTSNRPGRPLVVPLGGWRWPAAGLIGLLLANALVAPLVSLTYWLWRAPADQGLPSQLADLVEPATNTALVSVAAALVAVLTVLPVAILTSRYRSPTGHLSNALVLSGFALPGIAIALSVVFWTFEVPGLSRFYQTLPLLVFAYVIHFGAQAIAASHVAVAAVPPDLVAAARSLGASRLRALLVIEVPLMRSGLVAGLGLVMLSVMKELPATLLLAPTGFETLSAEIWRAQEFHSFAHMGLASLVLVAVSGTLTWALVVRGSPRPS